MAELLWQEALRMARAGVTEEELAEELAGFREVSLDPRSASSELGETAACLLLGLDYQDAPTRLDALARVTPEQAGQAFTTALATALLVVPCHVEAAAAARRQLSHPGDLLHHACVPAGRAGVQALVVQADRLFRRPCGPARSRPLRTVVLRRRRRHASCAL
ncbi:hypothetical protein [Streptomyces sp. NPDC000994]